MRDVAREQARSGGFWPYSREGWFDIDNVHLLETR